MKLKIPMIAVLVIAIVIGLLLLNSRPRLLYIVSRIEYRVDDATPCMLEVGPQGVIYAVEKERGKFFVRALGSDGELLWRRPFPASSPLKFDAIVASFPGLKPVCNMISSNKTDTRTLRVHVEADHVVTGQMIHSSQLDLHYACPVLADAGQIYMAGVDRGHGFPTMVAISNDGKPIWRRQTHDIWYGVADSKGNLVVGGTNGAGIGPFVAKYSRKGQPMWHWETGGGFEMSLGTDKRDYIYCVGSQHEGIMEAGGDCAIRRGPDVSLFKLSPEGTLVNKTLLVHGYWLDIVCAAVNENGEVVAVGNRSKTTSPGRAGKRKNAQLVKCDAKGRIVWSRAMRLPSGCLATDVRLDARGGIYVLGDGNERNGVKAFIYKVRDPQR